MLISAGLPTIISATQIFCLDSLDGDQKILTIEVRFNLNQHLRKTVQKSDHIVLIQFRRIYNVSPELTTYF